MEVYYNHSITELNDTYIYNPYENDVMFKVCQSYIMYNPVHTYSPTIVWIVILIGFPLTLLAIYSLYSQMRDDHVAPIFVINLLITDLIQMCCLVIWMMIMIQLLSDYMVILYAFCFSAFIYYSGVMASVFFMVCVALERYLIIAWPLWYRCRRNIKSSAWVSIIVWVFCFIESIISYFVPVFRPILLLLPLPLLIFFIAGSLKALSAAVSLSLTEKWQIIGTLVLVLLNYTLLFLPWVIWILVLSSHFLDDCGLCSDGSFINFLVFVEFSPLADLVLYIFIRKGSTAKLLTSLCCCKMLREEEQGQVASE